MVSSWSVESMTSCRADVAPLADGRRAAQAGDGLDRRVAADRHAGVDERGAGVDDRHAGAHVGLEDAALGDGADRRRARRGR